MQYPYSREKVQRIVTRIRKTTTYCESGGYEKSGYGGLYI